MADRPALVSVVLPTFNRAHLLERAVRSVLNQSFRDIELIVVDDASSDETPDVLARLGESRLKTVRLEKNKGGAAARNCGIEVAKGEFVAFQDSDDEWLPDKLAKQMALLRHVGPEVGAVYSGMRRIIGGTSSYIPGPEIVQREGHILGRLLRGNFIGTPTLIVRRELLHAAGGFWTELPRFQDWELVLRLAERTSFGLVDEPLVIAHDTPGNVTSNPQAGAEALEMILDRHRRLFWANQRALASLLYSIGRCRLQSGANAAARVAFLRAAQLRPWDLKAWAAWLAAFCGAGIYDRLAALWHRRKA